MNSISENARTILDSIDINAKLFPDKNIFTFLINGEDKEIHLSNRELQQKAKNLAVSLINRNCQGERVLLVLPAGLDFIVAFFACLYAGAVAVPASLARNPQYFNRMAGIIDDSSAHAILTNEYLLTSLQDDLSAFLNTDDILWLSVENTMSNDLEKLPLIESKQLAFLQYTSGSTGSPKGVMVSHENIISNQVAIQKACGHQPNQLVGGGWLPQFHDMGLIGHIMQPIFLGGRYIFISPIAFIQRPIRWLKLISKYQVNSSAAPNFAYDLCVSGIKDEDLAEIDLSSWKVALSGAEPVKALTIKKFINKFEKCGFKKESFFPCYGMAETTLFVSGSNIGQGNYYLTLDEQSLCAHTVKLTQRGKDIVCCGTISEQYEFQIVDPVNKIVLSENEIGEIWLSGPSITQGYWKKDNLNREIFHAFTNNGKGPFLRTGDLGFIRSNALFITGRYKEVIIIRGKNYYPHDIEHTLFSVCEDVRPNSAVVFLTEDNNEDKLVAFQEIKKQKLEGIGNSQLRSKLVEVVARDHGLMLDDVLLVPPNTIPKTSSGKIMRFACRDLYIDGKVESFQ